MAKLVIALLLLTAQAQAGYPAPICRILPSSDSGYKWGALYAAALAGDDYVCDQSDDLSRYPLLVLASGLVQFEERAGSEPNERGFARARLTVTGLFAHHVFVVATGDAAQRAIPDAFAGVVLGGLQLSAGRKIVPFGLERAWSDAKLPFLEHTLTMTTLAPDHRQHGVSLSVTSRKDLEITLDGAETEKTLTWHVEVGAFQPIDERDRYTFIGRAFVRRDRNFEYKSVDSHVHVGASAAIDGAQQRYAVELDARYYRYRATAELVDVSGEQRGRGAALTLSATIPLDRERWWTEPLQRDPVVNPRYVVPYDLNDDINPGFEIDLGIETLRSEQDASDEGGTTGESGRVIEAPTSTIAIQLTGHAFVSDYAKLSWGYTFAHSTFAHSTVNTHETTLRVQLAF